ncbi:MAG: type I DNA topoisomerase [Muribaculaceae bacterium]|nr:type I DNA topoisomerase [Muribaculaceae bacterium]
MAKNLVIVESPAKAKTIQKFLGNEYKVMSSFGHIRDLHKKDFSIDVENGFKPLYEIPEDKEDQVKKLKDEAAKADVVWLASDEDREGEAIAWHLFEVLGLSADNTRRIVFHEITEPAILDAIKHPRAIDLNLVDAQQARRVLDRIVGFELSPVLWRKIMPGLSAGRVQSVAVRLVAEREKEIKAFKSEPYYRVSAQFAGSEGGEFSAELNKHLPDHESAMAFLDVCKAASQSDNGFKVTDVTVKPVKRTPAPPFTTSTLQQEAARKLGLSVKQTMRLAQRLYEDGLITYMRTDSVNLSQLALGTISKEIKENIGERYLKVRHYRTTSKGAQEAHEAIRPTYINNHTITGTSQEKKLYDLIWKRTIASQMADAELEKTTANISIQGRDEQFVAEGEVVKFDGFLKVYFESADDNSTLNAAPHELRTLPVLKKNDALNALSVSSIQRYTQQPNRYTEASLVRRLEELGIGRPSTYAPIISTIQDRNYVVKGEDKGQKREYEVITLKNGKITTGAKSEIFGIEKGKLIPTDVGMVVNDFLVKYFPSIMDYNFTAKVEDEFDEVAKGNVVWNKEIADFYENFHPSISRVSSLRLEHKVGERILGNDPETGLPVMVKIGRYGPLVQMGSADNENKPRFASLQKGQSIETLTLEEAIKLFDMPRDLGEFEGAEVTIGVGHYGPYVKHGGKYVSIPKEMSPTAITLEEAVDLIKAHREAEAKKVLKTFDEEPELKVMNGRYGPYIVYMKQNVKIPKGKDAESLTLEECREIVADESNHSKGAARKRATRSTAKKTAKK